MGREEENLEAEKIIFHSSQEGWLVAFFSPLGAGPFHPWKVFGQQPWCKGGILGWVEEDLHFNPSSATSWLADVQGPTLRQMNALHDSEGLLSLSFPPIEWEIAQTLEWCWEDLGEMVISST